MKFLSTATLLPALTALLAGGCGGGEAGAGMGGDGEASVESEADTGGETASDTKASIVIETMIADKTVKPGKISLGIAFMYLDKGLRLLNENKAAELEKYKRATIANPGDPDSWFSLALAYSERGDYEQALLNFKKALELDPDNPAINISIGLVLKKLDHSCGSEAGNSCESALPAGGTKNLLFPRYFKSFAEKLDNCNGHLWLGDSFRRLRKLDLALKEYLKVKNLDPDCPEVWYSIGLVYADKGNDKQALEKFQMALNLSPNNHRYNNQMGHILMKLNRKAEAYRYLEKAQMFEMDPEKYKVLDNELEELEREKIRIIKDVLNSMQ